MSLTCLFSSLDSWGEKASCRVKCIKINIVFTIKENGKTYVKLPLPYREWKEKIKSTKKHTTFAFNSLLCLTVFKPFPPENSAPTLLLTPNSRTIKDQIFKLQGRNLLHRFQINYENVPNNNGLLFLRPTTFIMQRHW